MMATGTGIEWTDLTWNPVTGCTRVSKGCENCYAATLAARLLRATYLARAPVVDSDITRADPFAVRVWPDRLRLPEKWREPRMIFVNSMSDLFHAHVPTEFARSVFQTMLRAKWHTYQILTKRPARALRFWRNNQDLFNGESIPAHIWLGASVEDQSVDYRVRHLRSVPAEVRFLSCEPLIGPLSLDLTGIHWLIAGGESGPVRRPVEAEWLIELRNQCQAANVPFFFKQWGGRTPKAGGRQLEGRSWEEMPLTAGGR